MDKIIEVSDLHKSYGNIHAVKGISFYVEKGKLFAFLGPNGAGKSTTIDIICTFLKQDSGKVSLNGYELGQEDNQIRSVIGAVFQDGLLDPLLTIEAATGVSELLKRPYGKLSGGQRRRCDIARALLNTPTVLFLDEPTTGLDPQTRKSVWETIIHLQKKTGMTVFLTTHYMEEAAEADYIIVIDDGQIAAKGTPAELKENYAHDKLSLVCTNIDQVCLLLDERDTSYTCIADQIVIPLPSTMEALPIIQACKDHIRGFEVTSGTMDDAFIGITGKEVRE